MDHVNGEATTPSIIQHEVYARVGLLGNPSDVYYGRTISFTLANFYATVTLHPSDHLLINPHPTHDLVQFTSLDHLVGRLRTEGYYGGVRLLMSICKVFYGYCRANNIDLHKRNFTLSYDTNIPRQTGLSGSSAIVTAALNCLLDFYQVRHLIKVEIRPSLVLRAENELGIVAGLQDRVAQVYGGLVYMDFKKDHMEKLGHGIYTPMDINLLPPLHLIYAENPSDSGKVHSSVRQRWLDGDKFIISSMEEVGNLAAQGRTALLEKNYSKFLHLMNRNFDLRRSMFGDDVVGALNLEMVKVARKVGAASKFTGSGGAVVVFCPNGPSQVKLLEEACHKAGFIIQRVKIAPSCLNDDDYKTLTKVGHQ
ncbi:glucuronokinase 1 [Tripterygium wilfordii]|uniref:glucuronokinase n=1 Tax=Tripterygium wilfordii TaxID=458696 RepID=A0A7J7D2C0_TRIWF|nr:glucuronokinase 1-like [Tripterygium wilfordii]KAF5740418.1 glucuronokinase 1 [Tripterygium wilfordii]